MRKEKFSFSHKANIAVSFTVALSLVLFSLFLGTRDSSDTKMLFEKETDYYFARVIDSELSGDLDARLLFLDFDSHSIEYKNPKDTPLSYPLMYPVFEVLTQSDIQKINVIGGGAYTLPKSLVDFYEGSEVSVLEIDKEVSLLAEEYFNVNKDKIKTINEDARIYFNKNETTFDLIFGDAYNSFISVPWHLTTFEFTELIKSRLNNGGVYAVNFISAIEGEDASFFRSMSKTFSETFSHYYAFAFGSDSLSIQNIVLAGVKGEDFGKTILELKEDLTASSATQVFSELLVDMDNVNLSDSIILRDDYAPVEHLMLSTVKNYFSQYLNFYNSVFR